MKMPHQRLFSLLLFLSALLIKCSSHLAEENLLIVQVPTASVSETENLFLAGNFNGWASQDSTYLLERTSDSTFVFHWESVPEKAEFKVTRGSWETVELSPEGFDVLNHQIGANTVFPHMVKVGSWKRKQKPSTASENVSILANEFPMRSLNRTRKIWLYLPPSYATSPDRKYPVLYLHDAQNLFDLQTAPFGEWQVDESLDSLFALYPEKETLVVGIDHGADYRIEELSPFPNTKYGGGKGDDYLQFIVEELKPFIDKNYRSLKNNNHTAIGGSSLGGLISFYALLKYPDTFKKGLIFSPSFWFADQNFIFTDENAAKLKRSHIYFLGGEKESDEMVPDLNRIKQSLLQAKVLTENIKMHIVPEGKHNEAFWKGHFADAFLWLSEQ